MAYKNPNMKSPPWRSLRFPNHMKWEVHMVRTVDPTGELRLAMTIAKPLERLTLELRPIPAASSRIEKSAKIIEQHIVDQTPWYGWPEVVVVEEAALQECLQELGSMPNIEFELSVTPNRLATSQKHYESMVKTQPLWMNLQDSTG